MKWLTHIFVLSCRKATRLIDKSHDRPLSLIDRFQLRIHLRICDKCNEYQKQSLLIENLLKVNHKNTSNLSDLKLSQDFKSLIQNKIDQNLKKD